MCFIFSSAVGPQTSDVGHFAAVWEVTGEYVGRFASHVFILEIIINAHIDVSLRGPCDFGIVSVTNGGEGPVDVVYVKFARVGSAWDYVTRRNFDGTTSLTRRIPSVIIELKFARSSLSSPSSSTRFTTR